MPGLRRTAPTVLGAFALLVAMAWVPAAALAQTTGNISITSAGADGSGNPYDLTVVANNLLGDTLSSMTVHLSQGTTDVYDATMQYSTGPAGAQVWTPVTQIPTASLPVGTYTMTADASDTTGTNDEVDTALPAGTILVSYGNTTITVIPTATTVTEGAQSVTFNGTVTGTAQDGLNTQVPIPGAVVTVSNDSSTHTTAANGSFSYTATGIAQTTTFGFSVPAAGDNSYPAGSGSSTITANAAATVVSATPSQLNISQGSEQIIFSGSVLAGGAAVPGAPVNLAIGGVSVGQVATTASDGTFNYEATGVSAATDFNFSVLGGPLYTANFVDVPIGTAQATTLVTDTPSQTFVTQGANSITFTGQVQVTPPGSSTSVGIGSGIPVDLSVGSATASQVTTTTDAAGDFSYTVPGITQSTDYSFSVGSTSLYGAGNHDVSIPVDQAATAISATPTQPSVELGSQNVTFNGSVTMTPPGSTTAVSIGSGIPVDLSINGGPATPVTTTTDSSGDFSYPVTGINAASTSYAFSVGGSSLYSASSPATVTINAQPAQTTIKIPNPAIITFGNPSVTITGTVTGLPPGATAALPISGAPVYLNGGSSPVTTTDSGGNFSYLVAGITAPTTYSFSVPAGALYAAPSAPTPVQVSVTAGQTAVVVTPSPAVVNFGPQTVTFTGTVNVTPAGTGTSPEPNPTVAVDVSVNGGPPVFAGTTNSSGVFTDLVTGVMPGSDYDFSVAQATLYGAATSDVTFGKQSTTLAVKPTQSSVTEGSQTVTFNGKATGMVPGGSVAVPIQNASIYLDGGAVPVTTTDTLGNFSYKIAGIAAAASYDFSIPSAATYTAGTADVPIGITPAATRITAITVSPSKLKYGQKAKLQGTIQYLSGTSWTSLGGTTVHLAEGKTSLGTVSAGGTGAFSATLPTTHGFGWTATIAAGILTQQATKVGNLTISVPMKVKTFGANLGTSGNVAASGCLLVTAPVRYGPLTTVQIQYATGPRGKWRLLGKLPLHNLDRRVRGCSGPNESFFTGAIRVADDNAYYRADFVATDSFQGAVSKVIHAWRYGTKITSFVVSPHTVMKGQVVTMTGRLWRRTGRSWTPYGNRRVEIIYNEKGTSFWSNLGSVKTNSRGDFRQTAAGGGGAFTAIIYAQYGGSTVDLAARSPGVAVAIKQGSSIAASAPDGPQVSLLLASSGAQLDMLAQQDLLILGVLPAGTPTL